MPASGRNFIHTRTARVLLWCLIALFGTGLFVFAYYYVKFAHRIDARLASGPLSGTANLYAATQTVAVGDILSTRDVVSDLRQAGYVTSPGGHRGWYRTGSGVLEIYPGRLSIAGRKPAVLYFRAGKIARIVSLADNTERNQYTLDPPLIANISDRSRQKRRPVTYAEIPPSLVHAVISVEDKHFFHHSGFDILRILKAAYVDVRDGRMEQGASTLSMQLTRGLWLDPRKNWRRKAAELLMTLHLEEKLTKQQIFEYYCNQVYLGHRGSYSINGFGEAARVFFGKDIGKLTVGEAATLAGMVQRPSYYNPVRYPDRARERRNLVLAMMRQNGYLTAEQYGREAALPVTLAPDQEGSIDSQAAYFVDLVNQHMQDRLGDHTRGAAYVYTTLDPRLQRAANEAARAGMARVDALLRKKHPHADGAPPQVALVALDPHTGDVKAIVGGRDYAASQLNRALAERQPGSVFKPFVYAAALDTAVEGGGHIFTPASTILDAPTTFTYQDQTYTPNNFDRSFAGNITLRRALARSLNVPTVKLAEKVGYQNVLDLARRCGLGGDLQPTPAMALGAYETSPLDVAGAYTVFANGGVHVQPSLVSAVRSAGGRILYRHVPRQRPVLDQRVAYLTLDLMQEVLRSGTGASVRASGFRVPAAGKTGTSRDGWFAGFTSQLLCVVWVGFDDGHDLDLEGAHSALPIWTDFMKRALRYREYRDVVKFPRPDGIVSVRICNDTGKLATPYCPSRRYEDFIDGTQPTTQCELHALDTQIAEGDGATLAVAPSAIPQPPSPLAADPKRSP